MGSVAMVFLGYGRPWTECWRSYTVCGWPEMLCGRWVEKIVLLLLIVVLCGSTGYAQNTKECSYLNDDVVTALQYLPNETSVWVRSTVNNTMPNFTLIYCQIKNVTCNTTGVVDHWVHLHLDKINNTETLQINNTETLSVNCYVNITECSTGDETLKVLTSTNTRWALCDDPRDNPHIQDTPQNAGPKERCSSNTNAETTTTTEVPERTSSTQASDGTIYNAEVSKSSSTTQAPDINVIMKGVEMTCNRVNVALIFFIVVLAVLGGAVIYLYLDRMKKPSRDSEKHYFVENSHHSVPSCASASVELRPTNTSRQSTFVASQPLSIHNGHLNHTSKNMSAFERDESARKHLHPPLSKPPPPSDTQEPQFPFSGSLGDGDEFSKKPRNVPSSPPPAPKPTSDSMFPKTSGSLGDADHYPADNNDDDDEHDYDYLDINVLKQQMDKEKVADQMKQQMGKEETIIPKMEDKEKTTEEVAANLSRHDSENSLYDIVVRTNCEGN